MRIGIDVGGTNTDAAILDGDRVVAVGTVDEPGRRVQISNHERRQFRHQSCFDDGDGENRHFDRTNRSSHDRDHTFHQCRDRTPSPT